MAAWQSDACAIRRTSVTAMPERPEGEFERQGDQEMDGPLAGELDRGCDSGSTARGANQPEGQGGQQRLVRSGTTHEGKPCYWNALEARTARWVNKIQVFLSLVKPLLNIAHRIESFAPSSPPLPLAGEGWFAPDAVELKRDTNICQRRGGCPSQLTVCKAPAAAPFPRSISTPPTSPAWNHWRCAIADGRFRPARTSFRQPCSAWAVHP